MLTTMYRARAPAVGLPPQSGSLRQACRKDTILPTIAGLEITPYWRPARTLAGDCYDGFAFPDGSTAILIADVAGKGHPAAMSASNFQGAVRAYANQRLGPAMILANVNNDLCQHAIPGKFVTAFCGEFQTEPGRLVYSNAGHNPPHLLRFNGSVEFLESGGMITRCFRNKSMRKDVFSSMSVIASCFSRRVFRGVKFRWRRIRQPATDSAACRRKRPHGSSTRKGNYFGGQRNTVMGNSRMMRH